MDNKNSLKLEKIKDNAIVPTRSNELDAGLDLYSTEDYILEPETVQLISTGWRMSVPKGYEIQIRPRSGLSFKHKIMVLNSPGTVDAGYRGEVKVMLYNEGKKPYEVKKGDRIAQMVVNKIELWEPQVVASLEKTDRNDGGFGSTGV